MGDLVPFPKPPIELTEEEYARFNEYKEKMNLAKTKAEMDYYYSQAKIIIREALERKKQQP